ncbi:MAG: SlyX family protein [Rhodobacteraceae bacterium]|nr:SlyX family protein [Paracoccaceae bacterium]
MDDRQNRIEEDLAHLRRAVEDLSDVVARQSREIDTLTRRVAMLMQRAAEVEAEASGAVPLADQKPPHW